MLSIFKAEIQKATYLLDNNVISQYINKTLLQLPLNSVEQTHRKNNSHNFINTANF